MSDKEKKSKRTEQKKKSPRKNVTVSKRKKNAKEPIKPHYNIKIIVLGAENVRPISETFAPLSKLTADLTAGFDKGLTQTFAQALERSTFKFPTILSNFNQNLFGGLTAGFSSSVAGFLEPLNLQLNQSNDRIFGDAFKGLGIRYGTGFADTLLPLFQEFAESTQRLLAQLELEPDVAREVFREAGFWVTPSMSLGLFQELKRLERTGNLTGASVKTAILEFYRVDNGKLFVSMVQGWDKEPRFKSRMTIIHDARDAHLQGKYTLSIPAVLPLVEGIASEIVNQQPGHPNPILREAIETRHTDLFQVIARDALLDYVMNRTYRFVRFNEFADWLQQNGLNQQQVLHRAGILHGIQTDYASEENSLRVFLLLDALSWLD